MHSRSISPHKSAIRRLFLILTISLFLALMPESATAVPVQGSLPAARPHTVDLPPISLKYFEDMLHKIDHDTCVFYYHLADQAREWAKKKNPILNTVWWAFDKKSIAVEESPLKDYYEAGRSTYYWELMCEVYTKVCAGHSWVFIQPGDPDEPDNSVWTRVEYATIKKQETGIVKVERVDEKGENGRIIWEKPETGTAMQAGKNEIGTALQAGKLGQPPSLLEG